MNILVIGGTRFFGISMVEQLLAANHKVTVATRGQSKVDFENRVEKITLDRNNPQSMQDALAGIHFDVVIDKIAYCSNDVKYALDVVDCDRYIHMSSTAVYEPLHQNTKEEEFDAINRKLIWCNRSDVPYDEGKRQAECALWQMHRIENAVAVRYPFVIGKDDYTKRLLFYVEHTMRGVPMKIDNLDCQMGFIHSDEAGQLIAWLVEKEYRGPMNGCSNGAISIREILDYVEKKTGKQAILAESGEAAPYNGTPAYSINTDKACGLGFIFTNLKDWIFDLLDYYIEKVSI